MVRLVVNNSYSKVIGLNVAQEKALREELSYTVGSYASYYSGGFGPRKKSLLDKKCNFPTGLTHRVTSFLVANSISYEIKSLRVVPPRSTAVELSSDYKPYEDQERAAHKAEVYKRGIITMPTGSGKSLVIALIAARLNVRTLVVVPSLEIKKQVSEGLLRALNDKCRVTVENIDSPALKTMTDYDCLIIDEAHHVAAKTYQKLNKTAWTGIYYRFFLTATPFRNDTEETLLFESIAGKVIYQLDYASSVLKKYIVPIESYYIEIPKQQTDAYTWSEVYSQLVVNNSSRNEIIALTLLRLNASSVSTLCLVKEVAHGRKLAELTGLPFISGEDEESRQYIRKFSNGEITAVIATEGVMGEGVDTRACEYVIIAGLGKAKSAFMQKCGRAVRTYPGKESAKIILIKDSSHKFTLRHHKEQCKVLKDEYESVPIKLEI